MTGLCDVSTEDSLGWRYRLRCLDGLRVVVVVLALTGMVVSRAWKNVFTPGGDSC